MIPLILTLKKTTAQVVETSVVVNNKQSYSGMTSLTRTIIFRILMKWLLCPFSHSQMVKLTVGFLLLTRYGLGDWVISKILKIATLRFLWDEEKNHVMFNFRLVFFCLHKTISPILRSFFFLPIQTGFSGSCAPELATNPFKHSHLYEPTVLLQTWLAPQASGDWHSSKSGILQK